MMLNEALDVAEYASRFRKADPYEHVVIDDFLNPEIADFFADQFPLDESQVGDGVKRFESGYGGLKKVQVSPNILGPEVLGRFGEFNQLHFIKFLESVTGMVGLIPDPSYEGGGFHQTGRGGKLGIHVDFRVHRHLKLIRELNVIIYLNREWSSDWGGALELWSRDGKEKVLSVTPRFNRCVIFRTGIDSWHGHPHPLKCPDDEFRKSIALYYYRGDDTIYLAESRKTTDYIDGDGTSFELKNRLRYWAVNFGLEFVPPVLARWFFKK